jgi:hypothetical protein
MGCYHLSAPRNAHFISERASPFLSARKPDKIKYSMRSIILFLYFFNAAWPVVASLAAPGGCRSEYGKIQSAPRKVMEAWLRFHEMELCQRMDVVFYFSKEGVEAWCLVEDEKHYRKLEELFEPLRDSCRIELYATRPAVDEDSNDDWNPPPSFWENDELRGYLGDSRLSSGILKHLSSLWATDYPSSDEILKQRLLVYADEILEQNLKIKRYARDLPALIRVAQDPAVDLELRMKAKAVGREHAEELGKTLEKLRRNLDRAFPKSAQESPIASEEDKQGEEAQSLLERAEYAAKKACSVYWRVNYFVHPKQHTVDLDELRQPGLLDSVQELERAVSNFRKAFAVSVANIAN